MRRGLTPSWDVVDVTEGHFGGERLVAPTASCQPLDCILLLNIYLLLSGKGRVLASTLWHRNEKTWSLCKKQDH